MSLLLMLFRMVGGWLLLAVVAGLISGLSNASLLAMINHSLNLPPAHGWLAPGIQFALLACLMLQPALSRKPPLCTLGRR